ncbi:SPOR domain-containing protein [Sphingomonas sp. PAMC 26617]|uniref:SPOR domain-containing protein n=1 Tax=Sphingomonas sp. PAMC 26617 TaxID=1112216 RepID=UPI000287DF3B|nr:SPOR domain-containing protein [Sphingomonas sp. PAMC 26617]
MRTVRLAASILALTASGAGAAQTRPAYPSPYPQAAPYPATSPSSVQPQGDADALASEIRLLAADPNNVQSLVRAGELALKLDDATAAATFFARAARVDPRNWRIKAGEGSLLVTAERPGEALRHFAEAEALGGDVRSFAADRALAYDLIGEQDRAQRDYRLALRAAENDETRRRYALSLGISGKRELALKEIEPLLRKSDRGAWRSRAFILAMGGDRPGAERIATTMMPAGMAQGLQPFFDLLPTLRPADRAFAVHFGEVRASPTRLADARMAPPLRALGPDPTAPVEVAAKASPVVATVAATPTRKDRRSRKERERDTIVAATTPPVVPLPAPPAYVAPSASVAATTPYRGQPYRGSRPAVSSGTRAANLAAANALRSPAAIAAFAESPPLARVSSAPTVPSATSVAAVPSSVALGSSTLVGSGRTITSQAATPYVPPVATRYVPTASVVTAARPLSPTQLANAASAAPSASTPIPVAVTPVVPSPITPTSVAVTAPVSPLAVASPASPGSASDPALATTSLATNTNTAPSVPVAAPTPMRSEQSILASIIADISVPGSELGVAPERMAVTTPPPIQRAIPSRPLADEAAGAVQQPNLRTAPSHQGGKPATPSRTIDRKILADAVTQTDPAEPKRGDTRKTLAERKALAAKADLDEKTDKADKPGKSDKASKKAADAKKLADAKKAEEKRKNDPKLLEPERYWVQLASGANAGDLPKQWAKLKTKNAKALGARSGYVTPQRATNRVLTGPFKTDNEAQAFVNSLAKQGVSGFVFTSEAGQKVTKLPAK